MFADPLGMGTSLGNSEESRELGESCSHRERSGEDRWIDPKFTLLDAGQGVPG